MPLPTSRTNITGKEAERERFHPHPDTYDEVESISTHGPKSPSLVCGWLVPTLPLIAHFTLSLSAAAFAILFVNNRLFNVEHRRAPYTEVNGTESIAKHFLLLQTYPRRSAFPHSHIGWRMVCRHMLALLLHTSGERGNDAGKFHRDGINRTPDYFSVPKVQRQPCTRAMCGLYFDYNSARPVCRLSSDRQH